MGALLGALAFWAWPDDSTPDAVVAPAPELQFPPVEHDPVAAQALIDAWRRWRNATYYAEGTWRRDLDAGGSALTGPTVAVQQPPRRLVARLGSVVDRVEGAFRTCDVGADEASIPGCGVDQSAGTYADIVQAELTVVAGYVSGDNRFYSVNYGAKDGCWNVEVEAQLFAAPWGRWAEFCFDEAIGALRSSRVRRPTAVDSEQVTLLLATVTPQDFERVTLALVGD